MNATDLLKIHSQCFESTIKSRYISPDFMENLVLGLPDFFKQEIIGNSVENRPIRSLKFGSGKTKILMWSQMHGNESTTTKSLCDFFNIFKGDIHSNLAHNLLENFTFLIITMLNPDGAKRWTRTNANDVDLNRDAQVLSQPESIILRSTFDNFRPDYCFNLHGQRTIYGFKESGKPSVLSFLAPSANEAREFTLSRKRAAHIIAYIYQGLKAELPERIGLYDDSFNANCVGDAFQQAGVPTVLFEAGHFPDDYSREQSRKYVFVSLLLAIRACNLEENSDLSIYKNIPEHSKCYCDIHLKQENDLTAYQYEEVLEGSEIQFIPKVLDPELSEGVFAHQVVSDLTSFKR